jgi:membrane protease subunit HflK
MLPRGGFMTRTVAIVCLVFAGAWLLSGIYFVTDREQGFVTRFGQVVARSAQGINYHLPWPIESTEVVEVGTENQLHIGYQQSSEVSDPAQAGDVPGESYMLTRDEDIADINFTVRWVVKDASAYLFNVDNPDKTVKAVAESAMREIIGQTNFDTINTDREAIESRVREKMQSVLDLYGAGISVTGIHLGETLAPAQVNDAATVVQSARNDQQNMRTDAEAYASRVIPEARGEAAGIIQQAEADRQKSIAEASGEAKRFLSVYEEYRKAPEVTRRRIYLETMSQILQPMNKIIVDDSIGRGVVPYLQLPDLQKNRTETVTVTAPRPGAQTVPQLTQGPQ